MSVATTPATATIISTATKEPATAVSAATASTTATEVDIECRKHVLERLRLHAPDRLVEPRIFDEF